MLERKYCEEVDVFTLWYGVVDNHPCTRARAGRMRATAERAARFANLYHDTIMVFAF